jgi:hypothetical protein
MSAFFTDGRTALLAALQADATLSANVRSWFGWGPGLRRRYDIRPADCPLCSVVPAEMDVEQVANVVRSVPQDVEIGIATDGPDAAPCEELVCAALDVLAQADAGKLGLSSEGLSSVEVVRITWRAVERKDSPRVRWEAAITARINWLRR